MAWIESHQSLGRHPKTKATARALGISRVQLVGHLHYLWWWTLDFAEDGDLSGIDPNDIAEESMWEGDPDEFIAGLIAGGFLTEDMQIHDWSDYTGRYRESRDRYREANRERQRRYRERQRSQGENQPDPASNVTRNVTDNVTETLRNGPTLPNLTIPNHTEQNTNDDGADAPERARPNYSESFEKFWEAYPSGHGVKKSAYEQWKRLKPDDLLQRRILAGLERWKACERWQDGFVKSAHIWLRERWWENDPPPPRRSDPKHLHTPNHDEPFDFFAE